MKHVFSIIVLFFISQLSAQQTLKGTVTSASDALPLPGVSVIINGSTVGAQTDFDGHYEISAQKTDTIVFSYVGFVTKEVVVGNNIIINVSLEEDASSLDEVVVIGYGTKTSKSFAASSIRIRGSSSVSGKASGVSIVGGRSSNGPASGQLTAAEINDLEKWTSWKDALKDRSYRRIQNDWSFFLEKRVEVNVRDNNGLPVNNAEVRFYNDKNENLMISKTDMKGKAFLFKDLNEKRVEDYYTIQVIANGNVIGKKITKNYKALDFVLDSAVEQNNDVDIMFTVDATGSMGDEIAYLKSELQNIISRLEKSIAQKRVALTFYRDHGDAYVTRNYNFTSDIEVVQKNLAVQNAGGGGDYEEAVEEALSVSMAQNWNENAKAKLLFLMLDAPPHLTEENISIIQKQIKEAQRKGIKIIPVVASDANKTVEFLMRFFSVATNGTYVFLTDDSGIGNSHLKPTTPNYKVEKLNDLMVRLIEKYAGVEAIAM